MPVVIVNTGFASFLLLQIAASDSTLNFGIIILHNTSAVLFTRWRGLWFFSPVLFAYQAEVNMLSSKDWAT